MKLPAAILFIFFLLSSFITHAQSAAVEVWLRSFIPNPANAGGSALFIKPNPKGGSMVKLHPLESFNECFATDDRSFDTSAKSTSRMETRFTIRLSPTNMVLITPGNNRTTVASTTKVDCKTGEVIEVGNGAVNRDHLGNASFADGVVQVIGQAEGTNIKTIFGRAAPSIDCSFDIKWKPSTASLTATVTYGAFPAFEMYARQPGGDWVLVMKQLPTSWPWSLTSDMWGIKTENQTATVTVPGIAGKWEVTSADKRFSINLGTQKAMWTERNTAGQLLTREVPLVEMPNETFKIERPNDKEVLTFLGFQPALQAEILQRNPLPSYIILSRDGKNLKGDWYGLLVTKDNNGKLKELFQPGSKPPKVFSFLKLP